MIPPATWTAWWLPLMLAPFVGSFLGVLVRCVPAGEPWVARRSRCPDCGTTLGPLDLVPLLSWMATRGRCRFCHSHLGTFYPAIEVAAIAVAGWSAVVTGGTILWLSCGLGWTLLTLAWIDHDRLVLPDEITVPLIGAGLVATGLIAPERLFDHAIGAAIGLASFAAIAWLYRRIRGREGLGGGDAKLLAAGGAWAGWEGLPGVVLLAAVSGLTVAIATRSGSEQITMVTRIPFGPHLCLGIWIVWLYGPPILGWMDPLSLNW